jgi:hypothetical protein
VLPRCVILKATALLGSFSLGVIQLDLKSFVAEAEEIKTNCVHEVAQ